MVPDSNQLGAETAYSIYFTPSNEIPRYATVEVEFPQEYYKDLSSVNCITIKNIVINGARGSCSAAGNIVTITGAFDISAVKEGVDIGFKL